jgi:hypothetical protein
MHRTCLHNFKLPPVKHDSRAGAKRSVKAEAKDGESAQVAIKGLCP